MKHGLLKLINGIVIFCICNSASAALLDFTDSGLVGSLSSIPNGYSGTINGIGFTLTSTDGTVNFNQGYDGTAHTGCQSTGGALKCDIDGAGIDIAGYADDEITGIGPGNQTLTLAFDQVVEITAFYFLDLYVNSDGSGRREQATISIDGSFFNTVDATEAQNLGGYADLLTGSVFAQTLQFTANPNPAFWDDCNNDYALAGIDVNHVPLPPALWLFGSAVVGLVGSRKRISHK